MAGITGGFDANQFAPKQLGESHPIGKFPFTITGTTIEENKEKTGGFFKVDFTSPVGVAVMRYNLWNQSAKAVEIAHGQLSALCHAVGIFKLDWGNEGAALRNGKGMMEIGYQKGEEPTPEKPSGGYTEVKKVYDANGNEPGKPPQQGGTMQGGMAQPQANAPMRENAGGGWGQPQGQQNQPQGNQQPSGWGNPNPNNAPGGWKQDNAQQVETPPWRR